MCGFCVCSARRLGRRFFSPMNFKGCQLLWVGLHDHCEGWEWRSQEGWPFHDLSLKTPDLSCQTPPGCLHVVHTQLPQIQCVPNWIGFLISKSGFLLGSSSQQMASPFTESSRPEAGHRSCLFLLYHTSNNGRSMKLLPALSFTYRASLIPPIHLCGQRYRYPHCTDEETEAQGDEELPKVTHWQNLISNPVGQTFSFYLSWSSLPSGVLQRHSVGVQKRCVGPNGTDLEPFCTASPPCRAGNCCQHEVLLGEEGEKAKSGERMDGGLQREHMNDQKVFFICFRFRYFIYSF